MGSFTITGLEPLIKDLFEANAKMGRLVLRQALRDGAKVIQQATVPRVPRKSGALARQVKVRATSRKRGLIGIQVRTQEGFFKGKTFYGGFVEFGTGHRRRKGRKGGQGPSTGRMPALAPFAKGFDAGHREAAAAVENRIIDALRESGL